MKGNVIQMNTLHLNSVRLNGIGKVQSVSLKGGSTEDPVFPPVEPPIEPEPTPTYTLSASVTNGKVSALRNGSAVNLPFTANEGDVIIVEVTPNDGYSFEGWNDGNTDNPRTITMTADVVLSAQCVEVVVPPAKDYIPFEDAEVERVLMSKGVSSDGVGITMEDAERVTSIGTWFKGNTAITSFNELRYFTRVTTLDNYALQNCSNLASIDLSNIVSIGAYSLEGIAVNEMILSEGFTEIKLRGASKIVPLTKVDLPSTTTAIGDTCFVYCENLVTAIVRATTPPSLVANAFGYGIGAVAQTPIAKGTGVIYVPDASLEAYKTATNWVDMAAYIHPLSEIEGGHVTTFEGLIGAYTFEGRSNEDADRDIVEDKSGYNNTLTLKSMQWGFIDSAYPDVVREGLWDDALWLSVSGCGEIALPKGLTDFTVIAKRFVFSANAGREWAPLVGTGKSSGKGLFWLEYNEGNGRYANQVNGLKYTLSSLESEITWMTNTHYNGHRLTGTQGNDVHDGMVYINRFRGDVGNAKFQKIYAVYLFNRQLSPSEIEAFIKEKIDASYVLPTIEQ